MPEVLTMADDQQPADPGAPVPKDAIDPELVSLRPRTQVGLVTALSVVAFCVYLALRLWPDFQFAGEGAPRDVTVEQIRAGQVEDESHVQVRADVERAAAVKVRQSEAKPGFRLVPAVGGADRVWIALDADGWSAPRADPRYAGRLRRLDELPFAGALGRQLRAHPPARFVTGAELRRGRAAGDAGTLTAVTGDAFPVTATDEVEIVVPDPDAATIAASFGERLPDANTWATALATAGLIAPGAKPVRADDGQAWFEVRKPNVLADAPRALQSAGLWGARVEPMSREYRAPWKDVIVDDAGVSLGGARLAWSAVDVAAVHVPRPLSGAAWVVIVGDGPGNYWYVRALYVLIALFGLLFTWALIRTARAELLSPKVPTPVAE